MKTTERILMKAAIIQLLFLLLSQFILHQYGALTQINQLTKYEGVTKNIYSNIAESMEKK